MPRLASARQARWQALASARQAQPLGHFAKFATRDAKGYGEDEYLAGLKKKIANAASEEDHGELSAGGVSNLDRLTSITDDSMILSYTPMGESKHFQKQKVMLVGDPKDKVEAVARSYGWSFEHVTTYCGANPAVDPFAAVRRHVLERPPI